MNKLNFSFFTLTSFSSGNSFPRVCSWSLLARIIHDCLLLFANSIEGNSVRPGFLVMLGCLSRRRRSGDRRTQVVLQIASGDLSLSTSHTTRGQRFPSPPLVISCLSTSRCPLPSCIISCSSAAVQPQPAVSIPRRPSNSDEHVHPVIQPVAHPLAHPSPGLSKSRPPGKGGMETAGKMGGRRRDETRKNCRASTPTHARASGGWKCGTKEKGVLRSRFPRADSRSE